MGSQHIFQLACNKNPPITQTNIQTPGITKKHKNKGHRIFSQNPGTNKTISQNPRCGFLSPLFFFVCVKPLHGTALRFFGGARRLKRSFPAFLNLWNTEESFELFSKRRLHCEAHPKSRRFRRFFCFDKQEKWSLLLGGSSQLVSG